MEETNVESRNRMENSWEQRILIVSIRILSSELINEIAPFTLINEIQSGKCFSLCYYFVNWFVLAKEYFQ